MAIKSMDAFEQALDFEEFFRYVNVISDIDCVIQIKKNDKIFIIEIKKDTPKHTAKSVVSSNQWKVYRLLAANRPGVFLVYAVHNQDIDKNTLIKASDCKVKHIETEGRVLDSTLFEDLLACIHYFSLKSDTGKWYLIVKYPNSQLKYCIRNPIENHSWYRDTYINISCDFDTKQEALNYVRARYHKILNGKPINKDNHYLLFYKTAYSEHLEAIFDYNSFK